MVIGHEALKGGFYPPSRFAPFLPEPLPPDEHESFIDDELDELDEESWGGDWDIELEDFD